MGKLIFYDDKHIYEVDGKPLPSVSEVIRFLSREEYQDVSQYVLDNAADRGTKVHKACEQLIRFGECEIDSDIERCEGLCQRTWPALLAAHSNFHHSALKLE